MPCEAGRVRGGSEGECVSSPSPQDTGAATPDSPAATERFVTPDPVSYARLAVRPQPTTEGEDRMAGFLFRLETVEGDPAEPRTLECAVPNWSLGDQINLGHRTLVVVGKRDDDADRPPVLVVEEVVQSGQTGTAA
jgi:hypothetical protein